MTIKEVPVNNLQQNYRQSQHNQKKKMFEVVFCFVSLVYFFCLSSYTFILFLSLPSLEWDWLVTFIQWKHKAPTQTTMLLVKMSLNYLFKLVSHAQKKISLHQYNVIATT